MDLLKQSFSISLESFLLILLSCLGIYVAVIVYTRIFGSKMSSFDFAMTVAVGSVIATTILSETVNLIEGCIGLLAIYVLQLSAAYLWRYKWFGNMIDNRPTLLMDGSHLLEKNMKAVRVTRSDIRSKLREANVVNLSEVKAVIFETTGDIVVLHKEHAKDIDEWIMADVIKEIG